MRSLPVKIQERRFGRWRSLFLRKILPIRLHLSQIFPIDPCPIAIFQWLFTRRVAIRWTGDFAVGLTGTFAGYGTAVGRLESTGTSGYLDCDVFGSTFPPKVCTCVPCWHFVLFVVHH